MATEGIGGLQDMIVFARVVDAGSLTAAARSLGTTRSAVSKAVARLEARLGSRLLHRTTRELSPTSAGHAYYVHCARIAAEVDCAERTAGELRTAPRGALRVSCALSLGMLLSPAFPRFTARFPEVTLELELTENLVDLVRAGMDVGVRLGRLPDSSLVGRKIWAYRRLVCASPSYLSKHPAPKVPADLARHNCLIRSGQEQWRFWNVEDPSDSVRVRGNFRADTPEPLRQAALAGLGLAMVPEFYVQADVAAGKLVPVLERFEPPRPSIHAVYPNNRHLSPSVRAFVDFLEDEVPRIFGPEGRSRA